MGEELRPLYGELVHIPPEEDQSAIAVEINAMKEQIRLLIEEAAYSIAEIRGLVSGYELED